MTEFPVISLRRSDFADSGHNCDSLTEEDMVHAAAKVRHYLLEGLGYYQAVDAVAVDLNLPLKTECQ